MTKDEFKEWLRYHRAAFVGLSRWLEDIPKETTSIMQPTRSDVLGNWYRVLADTALDDAKAATDSMARGDDEEPMGWDRHPRAIRVIALRISRTRVLQTRQYGSPREERLRCLICRDSGTVRIWHAKSIRAAMDGTLGPISTLYTCAVACTCRAGDNYARTIAAIRGGDPAKWRFDQRLMMPAPLSIYDHEWLEELRAYAAALHGMIVDAQRYQEFNGFSGGTP